MTRVPVPNFVSDPGPETVPPAKVWIQAPVSSDPPPGPRIRFRWNVYPPDSDRIYPPVCSLMASTAPPAPVSLPSSPPVGVTWPEVCTTT